MSNIPPITDDFDQLIDKTIHVEIGEFQSLLVSNQNLMRCDFRSDNTRGVYDPLSRTRYYVHEQELFPYTSSGSLVEVHSSHN